LIFASRQKILKKQKSVNTYKAVDIGLHLFLSSAAGKEGEYRAPHQSAFLPGKKKLGGKMCGPQRRAGKKQRGK